VSAPLARLIPPLAEDALAPLRAGDEVRIAGTIYVARDAAHRRLVEALEAERELPFDPRGQIVYYMGPSPARPGRPIGAAGPTTSYRMDPYTPALLAAGIAALIGKGGRGPEVRQALRAHRAVYLVAVGGAAALIARSIRRAEVVAYPELGAEALRRLEVSDFPAIVGLDLQGNDVYEMGRTAYARAPGAR
jgi:fumarate hydratase subunit beta